MKVGTDGVLLGAWADSPNPKNILDIGTGTGLIMLMLAQRFPDSKLTGLEINKDAFQEALQNVSESIFMDRCRLIHSPVQEFKTTDLFDLIVSNPPFFEPSHPENTARNRARQQSDLSFDELLFHTKSLLTPLGKAAFIIPFASESTFLDLAKTHFLFPDKITRVKGMKNTPVKRSLISLSQNLTDCFADELVIEIERNVYTEEYIRLTQAFYLKM